MINGDCVEAMAFDDGSAGVRNSRKPDEGVLHFIPGEWHDFLAGVKNGEFGIIPSRSAGPGCCGEVPGLFVFQLIHRNRRISVH